MYILYTVFSASQIFSIWKCYRTTKFYVSYKFLVCMYIFGNICIMKYDAVNL